MSEELGPKRCDHWTWEAEGRIRARVWPGIGMGCRRSEKEKRMTLLRSFPELLCGPWAISRWKIWFTVHWHLPGIWCGSRQTEPL